jgi:hypothetical protein
MSWKPQGIVVPLSEKAKDLFLNNMRTGSGPHKASYLMVPKGGGGGMGLYVANTVHYWTLSSSEVSICYLLHVTPIYSEASRQQTYAFRVDPTWKNVQPII